MKAAADRGRSGFLAAAGLFALLVLVSYADPLATRRIFSGRDLIAYNHPMEHAIHEAYAAGRLPVWMSEVSGGRPLAANPNAGALYPLRPLLARVSFPAAVRLFPVLHWVLAGWGMLWLSRRAGVSPPAGWIAAVAYVFSGVGVSEVFFPNVQPGMALLPWIVGVAAAGGSSTALRAVAFAGLFALDMLAGDVFTTGAALACSVLWIALETAPPARRGAFAALAVGVGLAAVAALPQIVATLLWAPQTNRAVLGIRLNEAFYFSLSPWRLLELVVPFPFGDTWELDHNAVWGWKVFHDKALGIFGSLYVGAVAVIAVAVAWRGRSRGLRFARVLLAAALLLSVPPSLLPARWQSLPAPIALRNPEKFAVLLVLALALFSAYGVERFRAGALLPRWALPVGGLLAGAALVAARFPAPAGRAAIAAVSGEPARAWIASARLPGALAEGGLLWMASAVGIALLPSRRRAARGIGLVLLTAVPIAANRRIARTSGTGETLAPPPFARWVQRSDPAGQYRVLGESLFLPPSRVGDATAQADPAYIDFARRSFYQHTHAPWGIGTVVNYDFDVGDFSRVESVRRLAKAASEFSDSQNFYGALSLRYGIRYRDQTPLAGYRRVRGDALQDWDEHAGAFPDVRLLERWVETSGAAEALGVLSGLPPGAAVLETGTRRTGASPPGRARVTLRSAERLSIDIDAAQPGWLFVLRPYWSGRTVEVDGRRAESVPAQLAFTALPVPAGRHRIDWREEIPGWRLTRLGPVLAGVLAAGAIVAARRARAA